jgi:predicted RNA-binding Zn-ribbon protein involved in translation (DUF1610 family)
MTGGKETTMMHPSDTGPGISHDDESDQLVLCPDCGQMEWWTAAETRDHGKCRTIGETCPVCEPGGWEGWYIGTREGSDSFGDLSGCDEATSVSRYCVLLVRKLREEFPGAEIEVEEVDATMTPVTVVAPDDPWASIGFLRDFNAASIRQSRANPEEVVVDAVNRVRATLFEGGYKTADDPGTWEWAVECIEPE